MVEAVRDLIDQLARAEAGPDVCNQYSLALPANTTRRTNLERYLSQMLALRPPLALIGEAPGYLGCRRTGIPFSSERLLLKGIDPPGLLGQSRGYTRAEDGAAPRSEQTATIIWGELLALQTFAVGWNAFPFHPHRLGLPESNRKPRAGEVQQGQLFLRMVLDLFPEVQVVAVGNTAAQALSQLGVPHQKVRHPAQGGKLAFAAGLRQIVLGIRSAVLQ